MSSRRAVERGLTVLAESRLQDIADIFGVGSSK